MKSCKNCYHYNKCNDDWLEDEEMPNLLSEEFDCPHFKDKDLIFELPCKLGSEVFVIGQKYRHGKMESWLNTGKFKLSDIPKLGISVFPKKEYAVLAIIGDSK